MVNTKKNKQNYQNHTRRTIKDGIEWGKGHDLLGEKLKSHEM